MVAPHSLEFSDWQVRLRPREYTISNAASFRCFAGKPCRISFSNMISARCATAGPPMTDIVDDLIGQRYRFVIANTSKPFVVYRDKTDSGVQKLRNRLVRFLSDDPNELTGSRRM